MREYYGDHHKCIFYKQKGRHSRKPPLDNNNREGVRILKKKTKTRITDSGFNRLRSAVIAHCVYGKDNACDGSPMRAGVSRRPPCRYYIGKCTNPPISAAKGTAHLGKNKEG